MLDSVEESTVQLLPLASHVQPLTAVGKLYGRRTWLIEVVEIRSSTDERIIVGVSGSANSAAALRWAAAEARLRAAVIWAVHAWSSQMEMLAPYAPLRGVPSRDQQRQASNALLTAAISHAFGPGADGSETNVRAVLVEGHPAAALLRYAIGARLLVLGRRLRASEPGGIALGVVARTCIAHAPCPTVLIAAAGVADNVETSSSSQGHLCIGR